MRVFAALLIVLARGEKFGFAAQMGMDRLWRLPAPAE
jgi:hypothetical protein